MYTGIIKCKGDGFSMSTGFDAAAGVVKEYLSANNYSNSITASHIRCYRLLGIYMAENGKAFNKVVAEQWLQTFTPGFCKSTLKVYRQAVGRLETAYHGKEIENTKIWYEAQQRYSRLDFRWKAVLDAFMKEIPEGFHEAYQRTFKISIARFLDYLTLKDVSRLEDISHQLIIEFYRDDKHDSYKAKDVYNNCIRRFLSYLSAKGITQASIPLMLDKFAIAHLVFVEALPVDARESLIGNTQGFSIKASEYYKKTIELHAIIEKCKYSKSMKKVFRQAWREFFIFLEANSLEYSRQSALAWADHMSRQVSQWKSFRRAFMLFEQYWADG